MAQHPSEEASVRTTSGDQRFVQVAVKKNIDVEMGFHNKTWSWPSFHINAKLTDPIDNSR